MSIIQASRGRRNNRVTRKNTCTGEGKTKTICDTKEKKNYKKSKEEKERRSKRRQKKKDRRKIKTGKDRVREEKRERLTSHNNKTTSKINREK